MIATLIKVRDINWFSPHWSSFATGLQGTAFTTRLRTSGQSVWSRLFRGAYISKTPFSPVTRTHTAPKNHDGTVTVPWRFFYLAGNPTFTNFTSYPQKWVSSLTCCFVNHVQLAHLKTHTWIENFATLREAVFSPSRTYDSRLIIPSGV